MTSDRNDVPTRAMRAYERGRAKLALLGEHLVGARVEGANHHGIPVGRLDRLPIRRVLLILVGKPRGREEEELGPKETDAAGSRRTRRPRLAREGDVRAKGERRPARGRRGLFREQGGARHLLLAKDAVGLRPGPIVV